MKNYSDKNYPDFFKEELYGGFVQYLLDEYGANTIITLLRGNSLVTKKGFNLNVIQSFNRFLDANPAIRKVFVENRGKCMNLRNISGGPLAFPIDTEDDVLMSREGIRLHSFIPVENNTSRATKGMKRSAARMKGQTIKGESDKKKYLTPMKPYVPISRRLTVHFKEGYATKIGKTTMSFMVDSRSEAMVILLDRFEKKVAYATIQGKEEFFLH